MYHVVLVDDEIWPLENLLRVIDWKSMGFQVDSTFTDSEEAYDYILEHKPDLVLTDIRMPGLSGIELGRKVRESVGDCVSFVIVSGYSDFSYAQEAISLGFRAYLLKPVCAEDLLQMLHDQLPKLQKNRNAVETEVVRKLLSNSDPASLLPGLNIQEEGKSWQVFFLTSRHPQHPEWPPVSLPHDVQCWSLHANDNGEYRLFCFSPERGEVIETAMGQQAKCEQFCVGASQRYENASQIPTMLREAELASSICFIEPDSIGKIVFYEPKALELCKRYIDAFSQCVRNENKAVALDVIRKIPALIRDNNLTMLHVVYIFNEMISVLLLKNPDRACEIHYMDFSQLIACFGSLKDIVLYFEYLLTGMETQGAPECNNENFIRLLAYVDSNFQQTLSLRTLSDEYYLGFSYCSHLFHKYTGKTFSDYILEKRMTLAKELLTGGGVSVEEAAHQAGFSDPYYFSKKFKKFYGVSPSFMMKS